MPKAYWIARVDITGPEHYKLYIAANAAPFKKYGAKFLARGGRCENPEGSRRTRNAIVEFPDYAAAVECWHSPQYQAARQLRLPVSTADVVLVEGYDGPQPA